MQYFAIVILGHANYPANWGHNTRNFATATVVNCNEAK